MAVLLDIQHSCYWMDGAADVAETSYTPFHSEPGAAAVRLIVRRVKPTPGSQLALLATYSYHAFITDRDGDTLELEADHRRHAEIENAIRDLKYGVGLNHLPSGRFAANPELAEGRLAGCAGYGSQPGALDGAYRSGRAGGDHQDAAAAILLPGRSAHPLGAPPDPALASALALGDPVHWRPDPIAHPAASLLTVAPATGPPYLPSSTSQSKVSPTRGARIGQREFLAAFGHLMSSYSHRQQAIIGPPVPYPPGRSLPHPRDVLFQRSPHSVRWIRAYEAGQPHAICIRILIRPSPNSKQRACEANTTGYPNDSDPGQMTKKQVLQHTDTHQASPPDTRRPKPSSRRGLVHSSPE